MSGWLRTCRGAANFRFSTNRPTVGDTRVQKTLGSAEPFMQDKKLWVAITAHNPLSRLECLIGVVKEYSSYPCEVLINVYVNYDAQDSADLLKSILERVSNKTIEIRVASPGYENWYLTWAHKTDLALAVLNRAADFYIYQENDMHLSLENFKYWYKWQPRLKPLGLEPGFARFEKYSGKRVLFDNYFPYSLTRVTPKIWGDRGFEVSKILVLDREVNFFVQLANPYYGAMILAQSDAEKYIRTASFDPELSYSRVGVRNWPIADRSSMGLAFESPPTPYEHRRCVPVHRTSAGYEIYDVGLIWHEDTKYSVELERQHGELKDCATMLSLD